MILPRSRYVRRGVIVAILIVTSSFVARVGQGAEPDPRSLTIVPEAASIDEAASIASGIPAARFGSIEVRPIMVFS